MAVKVVNPLALTNGTGSLISPLNAWPTTYAPGDTVVQLADTIWSGNNGNPLYNIICSQSGTEAEPITLGVCEPQTGVIIRDGSKKAIVDGTGRSMGVRTAAVNWVTINGFEVRDVTGTGSSVARGIYAGSSSSAPASHIRILNCHVHDIPNTGFGDDNAVQVFGNDCEVSNVRIHDIADDGIWFCGNRGLIQYNDIQRIGQASDITGDGIQCFGDTNLGISGMVVRFNYVDHSEYEEKQCLILQGDVTTSVGAQAYGNIFKHYRNPTAAIIALYIEMLDVSIWGNWIEGGYYGIFAGTTAYGTGNNMRVMGNVVKDSRYGIAQGSSNTGAKVFNNTVDGCSHFGIYADNDISFVAKNNILINNGTGIGHEGGGATEDYNCFYGNGADKAGLGGGAVPMGANSITSNPLLDSSYRLTASSPCKGQGIYIPGARHFGGVPMNAVAPDIGAHRYFAARPVAGGYSTLAGVRA